MRRWLPAGWPYVWRQGLANLHRPANQTVTLVLAIGFGAFLLGTLYLVQYNLLRQLRLTGGPARPNLVLFDIQPDQLAAVERELHDAGLPMIAPTPIVPMRIRSVKGRPVTELLAGSSRGKGDGPSNAWVFRREYRSTYRDSVVASERIVAGKWSRRGESPARISVERDLAGELGVGLGDEIVWDVQGVPVTSRVGSLREVDWARFEPNFFVVFAPGTLESAPQTFVTLTRVASAADRGSFQRRLAERFPNVSTLDLSMLQEALERLVDRVALAIRFMALFSLVVGALVLVGALASSRFQRVREGALLRTLGATRGQVFRVVLAEYLSLGLLASAVALVLAAAAGWAISRFVFEGGFTLPLVPPERPHAAGRGAHGHRWPGQQPRCGAANSAGGAARGEASYIPALHSAPSERTRPHARNRSDRKACPGGRRLRRRRLRIRHRQGLAEAGATICLGSWPPALGIFTKLLERGKMEESMRLADGRKLEFERIYPLDAAFDTLADAPAEVRENKRYKEVGDFSIQGMAERIRSDFGEAVSTSWSTAWPTRPR